MSGHLNSWIASAVIKHDKEHGANFNVEWTGRAAVQLVEFLTYRSSQDPHKQIVGVVSDQTHLVNVQFDVGKTDEYEQPCLGIDREPLTASLRGTFILRRLRFKLRPSRRTGEPRLVLEVLEWKVWGDANSPVYCPGAVRLGEGGTGADESVRGVLRKWWTGVSSSAPLDQPAQPALSVKPPSAQTASPVQSYSAPAPSGQPPPTQRAQQPAMQSSSSSSAQASSPSKPLDTRLDDVPHPSGLRSLYDEWREHRALPSAIWVFAEPDAAARAELSAITVTGLDPEAGEAARWPALPTLADFQQAGSVEPSGDDALRSASSEAKPAAGPSAAEKGKARARAPSTSQDAVTASHSSAPSSVRSPIAVLIPPVATPAPSQAQVGSKSSSLDYSSISVPSDVTQQARTPAPPAGQPARLIDADSSDDDDGSLPVRPLARPPARPPRRSAADDQFFEPHPGARAAAASSQAAVEPPAASNVASDRDGAQSERSAESGDEDEADASGLSDYERQQRAAPRRRAGRPDAPTQATPADARLADDPSSLEESQHSGFRLLGDSPPRPTPAVASSGAQPPASAATPGKPNSGEAPLDSGEGSLPTPMSLDERSGAYFDRAASGASPTNARGKKRQADTRDGSSSPPALRSDAVDGSAVSGSPRLRVSEFADDGRRVRARHSRSQSPLKTVLDLAWGRPGSQPTRSPTKQSAATTPLSSRAKGKAKAVAEPDDLADADDADDADVVVHAADGLATRGRPWPGHHVDPSPETPAPTQAKREPASTPRTKAEVASPVHVPVPGGSEPVDRIDRARTDDVERAERARPAVRVEPAGATDMAGRAEATDGAGQAEGTVRAETVIGGARASPSKGVVLSRPVLDLSLNDGVDLEWLRSLNGM